MLSLLSFHLNQSPNQPLNPLPNRHLSQNPSQALNQHRNHAASSLCHASDLTRLTQSDTISKSSKLVESSKKNDLDCKRAGTKPINLKTRHPRAQVRFMVASSPALDCLVSTLLFVEFDQQLLHERRLIIGFRHGVEGPFQHRRTSVT